MPVPKFELKATDLPIVVICVGRPNPVYWNPCGQTVCPVLSGCETGYTMADVWALPDRDIGEIKASVRELVDRGFVVNIRVPERLATEVFNQVKYPPDKFR